jgi:S-disulfanyl-L-cysteine oxidoreductase SoxD
MQTLKTRAARVLAALCILGATFSAAAQTATLAALQQIGRPATAAEVKAWDIDVRADFKGLPAGSGTVAQGEQLWEAQCASCHGVFGESNEVFTPIVGGTTAKDIETGRVQSLLPGGSPHRTTLMKVSKLSTLWDYINRAMPWNAPKSLKPDEVYAVLAHILHLGDIVPADFTLSDRNMAEVQARLPNRNGKVLFAAMWDVRGKGDVVNPLCMKNCPIENTVASTLPDFARNTHGNIADQVRPFGAPRGTDTAAPPRGAMAGAAMPATAVAAAPASPPKPAAAGPDGAALVKANGCTACHGMANRIVGPAFKEIAQRHAGKPESVDYLASKIRSGGQGVWGAIPMPAQAQLKDADLRAMAQWLVGGAP